MKSWLLDASMELLHSYDEGDTSIYTVILEFKDLFGCDRRHLSTIDFPKSQVLQNRISFTAMSSVGARPGLIESVSDLTIRIVCAERTIDVVNRHMFQFKMGQPVYLVEHMDVMSGSVNLCEVVIPHNLPFALDTLRLQTVNADILDDAGNLLYRLSADSLPGGCYDARVAT